MTDRAIGRRANCCAALTFESGGEVSLPASMRRSIREVARVAGVDVVRPQSLDDLLRFVAAPVTGANPIAVDLKRDRGVAVSAARVPPHPGVVQIPECCNYTAPLASSAARA